MVTVTPAGVQDLDALVALESLLFAEDAGVHDPHADITWPAREGRADFEHLLASASCCVLVARRGNDVVGCLVGYRTPSSPTRQPVTYAVLRSLYVVVAERRHGVARLLTERFVDWARQHGCVEAHVDSYVANHGAQQFYERLGFVASSTSRVLSLGGHTLSAAVAPAASTDWRSLTDAQLRRIADELRAALADRTADEMAVRVAPSANPVGWLAWHLTRSHDRNLSEIAGVAQRWIGAGWYERFDMAADPNETGFGHTPQQVAAFRHVDGDALLAYHDEVVAMAATYLAAAPLHDLARLAPSPTLGTAHTVQQRIVGVLNEGFQHLGQIRLTY